MENNLIEKILNKELSFSEKESVFKQIINGDLSEIQSSSIITAFKAVGENEEDIFAAVSAMRSISPYESCYCSEDLELIDVCGTGGDGLNTFNISTAVSFVVAAAGCQVAKHGGRSVSSMSGSADILEEAGLVFSETKQGVLNSIRENNFGFIFAPFHHNALKRVALIRKELKTKTIFNIVAPLSNPFKVKYHLMGVHSRELLMPVAKTLFNMGVERAWVVRSSDGLDEISIGGFTEVLEVSKDGIKETSYSPLDAGYPFNDLSSIKVNSRKESLDMIMSVLNNSNIPAKNVVCMNAGAAIYICGKVESFVEGVRKAEEVISSGKALSLFNKIIQDSKGKNND